MNPVLKLHVAECINDATPAQSPGMADDTLKNLEAVPIKIERLFGTMEALKVSHELGAKRIEEKLDDLCERIDQQNTALSKHVDEDQERLRALETAMALVKAELEKRPAHMKRGAVKEWGPLLAAATAVLAAVAQWVQSLVQGP